MTSQVHSRAGRLPLVTLAAYWFRTCRGRAGRVRQLGTRRVGLGDGGMETLLPETSPPIRKFTEI